MIFRSSKRKYTHTDKKLHCLLIELVSLHVNKKEGQSNYVFNGRLSFQVCRAHLDYILVTIIIAVHLMAEHVMSPNVVPSQVPCCVDGTSF